MPDLPRENKVPVTARKRWTGVCPVRALPLPVNGGEELGSIVVKACAHKPEDRFASAAEFKNALENVLRGMDSESRDESVTPLAAAKRRRDTYKSETAKTQKPDGTVSVFSGFESAAGR